MKWCNMNRLILVDQSFSLLGYRIWMHFCQCGDIYACWYASIRFIETLARIPHHVVLLSRILNIESPSVTMYITRRGRRLAPNQCVCCSFIWLSSCWIDRYWLQFGFGDNIVGKGDLFKEMFSKKYKHVGGKKQINNRQQPKAKLVKVQRRNFE